MTNMSTRIYFKHNENLPLCEDELVEILERCIPVFHSNKSTLT